MLPALLILCFVPTAAALGRTQSVGVKGVLICNDKPAADVEVKLYDEDKRKLSLEAKEKAGGS
ncbi:hypothetical protein TELCIR_06880, partial [Teladorsagia circumcincta]